LPHDIPPTWLNGPLTREPYQQPLQVLSAVGPVDAAGPATRDDPVTSDPAKKGDSPLFQFGWR